MDPFTSLCILSVYLSLSEGKKDDQGKNTAKGESWRDKPTDGKLQQRLSSSLIKQNNCWVQLAPTSNSRCSAELYNNYTV